MAAVAAVGKSQSSAELRANVTIAKVEATRLRENVIALDRMTWSKGYMFPMMSIILAPGDNASLAKYKKLVEERRVIVAEEYRVYEETVHTKMGPGADEIMNCVSRKLSALSSVPRNGVCYYVGYWQDQDGEQHFANITVDPPTPLPAGSSFYISDCHFHTEVLRGLLTSIAGAAHGLVVFDFTGLIFARICGPKIEVLQRVSMQIPRYRSTFHAEDSLMKKAVEFLQQTYTDETTKKLTIASLILAGDEAHKLHHKLLEALPAGLKGSLQVRTVDVDDEEEDGMFEALEKCTFLTNVRLIEEIQLLREFFKLHADSPSKVVVGAAAIDKALAIGKVKSIIVYEDLKVHVSKDGLYWEEPAPAPAKHLGDEIWVTALVNRAPALAVENGVQIELVSRGNRAGAKFWKDFGAAAILKD
jgi:peptide subunit release factor 1 (eRF1)